MNDHLRRAEKLEQCSQVLIHLRMRFSACFKSKARPHIPYIAFCLSLHNSTSPAFGFGASPDVSSDTMASPHDYIANNSDFAAIPLRVKEYNNINSQDNLMGSF